MANSNRIRFFLILFLTLLYCLIHQAAFAQEYQTSDGQAKFHSTVPLHSFTGESEYLNGLIDFEENLVDFYLDLSTLKTGNSSRDSDMYTTLNIDQYPFAEFTGSIISDYSFNPDSLGKQPVTVSGEFTLNGITVSKTVEGSIEQTDQSINIKAKWVLDITDYQIEPPGILFYRVRDEMDVEISAELFPVQSDSQQ